MSARESSLRWIALVAPGSLTWWAPRAGLVGVALLGAILYGFRLDQNGYGNPYYAAAVKSMLASWHNFFFVSFDPGGFVSVDKPPLGLWVQVASAKVFGFQGWSLLLPQAVAGVLAIAVLYHLVRRGFGPLAGLLAALALALTPITAATSRNNTSDEVLVLVLLLAAWAVLVAVETGRLRWLALGAALVGVGFNVKMLEAFLPLPAFYVAYLVGAPRPWRTRLAHLSVATLVLLGVSLPWAVAVDLTPTDQRPYVGSSADNTVRNLILGYNGLTRVLGMFAPGLAPGAVPPPGLPMGAGPPPSGPGASGENGAPGPLRLLDQQLAGQISWLLPLALFGLIAAVGRQGRRWPLDPRQQALVLWGIWLLTEMVFFSVAGMIHRYYLVMLAPPIAALVGIGALALWEHYRRPGLLGWLLPLALVTTAALQLAILADEPDWSRRLTLPLSGLSVLATSILVAARLRGRMRHTAAPALAVGLGGLVLLVAPAIWAAYPLADTGGMRNMLPFAGPASLGGPGPFGGPVPPGAPPPDGPPPIAGGSAPPGSPPPAGGPSSGGLPPDGPVPPFMGPPPAGGPPPGMDAATADPRLLSYLAANRADARFLVAVPSAMQAAPIILATGEPVMALGGFAGGDRILTTDALATRVGAGDVRFFLLPAPGSIPAGVPGPGGFGQADVSRWVADRCASVPADLWRSADGDPPRAVPPGPGAPAGFPPFPGPGFGMQLYDCGGPTLSEPAPGDPLAWGGRSNRDLFTWS
jgi:4-amino-4-deoxy-L-arabinose transferase-like glycosyltransferase